MVHEVGPTTAEVHHEQRNQEPLDGKVFAFAPRDAQPKGDLVGEQDRGELGGFNGVFNGVFSLVFNGVHRSQARFSSKGIAFFLR